MNAARMWRVNYLATNLVRVKWINQIFRLFFCVSHEAFRFCRILSTWRHCLLLFSLLDRNWLERLIKYTRDRVTLSRDVNPFGGNLGADMVSLKDRATRQKRGTGKYLSRGARSMPKRAFKRSVGGFIAFGSRLTFSAGRVMYAKRYKANEKRFCTHEKRDTSEKMRVMRSRKWPSSWITRFSKQSHVQTLGDDVWSTRAGSHERATPKNHERVTSKVNHRRQHRRRIDDYILDIIWLLR